MYGTGWLICAEKENIPFILGHALYMKAIHGGKAKNDKIDAHKIATLLRGGMLPIAYVYPSEMRSTRDILRRRTHFMRKREGVAERYSDKSVRKSIEVNLSLHGTSGEKIGNVHLKWAFSEAAVLFLRRNPEAKKHKKKLERKHGKAKALSILAHIKCYAHLSGD